MLGGLNTALPRNSPDEAFLNNAKHLRSGWQELGRKLGKSLKKDSFAACSALVHWAF